MIDIVALAVLIFTMRVLNYAIGTLRLVAITRQRRIMASALAAVEAFVFAVVIANVIQDLENVINLTSYCLGASVGSYVGMMLEARYITGFAIVNVITSFKGHDIAIALREKGHGVTETRGEGKDGVVTTLRTVVNKRNIPQITQMVHEISPEAFITIEDARMVQRGWVQAPMPGRDRVL